MAHNHTNAINYVAVSEALGVSPSVLTAGLAADNVVVPYILLPFLHWLAIYLQNYLHHPMVLPNTFLYKLKTSSTWPNIENLLQNGHQDRDKLSDDHKQANNLPVLQSAMAVTVSFTICKLGTYITNVIGLQGGKLPCITAIIVVLATMFPTQFGALAPSGEAIALLLMQVFFAVVGANGSVRNVINTTPAISAYSTIQIAVHVAVILGLDVVCSSAVLLRWTDM
ncbi:hypothetical protein HPP92_005431 [Vanilla planifolia]|uniref:Uncharacterized protein n=1 Tax=Vanilla planifolia TaxID=51239 RepID=A0A835RTU7_VANPL|nr:hypothetical protein HPP92_005431 [Vanilla planifolia]